MFRNIIKYMRNQKSKQKVKSAKSDYTDQAYLLSKSIDANISNLKKILGNSDDLIFREFNFGVKKQIKAFICCIDGLVDKKMILDNILKSLMVDIHIIDEKGELVEKNNLFNDLKKHILTNIDADEVRYFNDAINSVLSGNVCLLIDGSNVGFTIKAQGEITSGNEQATNEIGIRGPRVTFVESLRTNTSMLRKIIKTPNLTFESFVLGKKTRTDISIAYINDIANNKIVEEVRKRLNRINIDSVLESGYIEQLIEDSSFSPFATVGNSERPDKVAAKLLEGRVAIICDGTPVVLTVPYMFIEAFQVPDDYYSRMFNANILRLLRFIGFAITLTLPALFVAITTFHQEMIPTILLIKLTAAREGIPFPVLIGVLITETIFLLIRESGIRMPRATGSAVTIVGTLVMGDAAVNAGLIGAPMVIVTALSGITGFILPALYNAIVIYKYILIIMGGFFGLYGVVIALLCILAHMCSLRSFGTPFLAPLAPIFWSELKDTFIRFPIWSMRRRPQSTTWKKSNRQAHFQKPGLRKRKGG